jgi:hypothetical protein
MCVQVFRLRTNFVYFFKNSYLCSSSCTIHIYAPAVAQFIFMLQQLHNSYLCSSSYTIHIYAPAVAQFIFMLQQLHNSYLCSSSCTIHIYAPAVAQYRIRCLRAGPWGTLHDSDLRGTTASSFVKSVQRELSMLREPYVTSLHEAESFTGILPQGSLFPTLIRLLCQCIRLLYISSVIRLKFIGNY